MKTISYSRTLRFIVGTLLSGVILTAGCRKRIPYEVQEQPKSQTADSKAPGKERSFCYVIEDYHQEPLGEPAVSQISILKYQMAIVALHGLEPGRQYSADFHCYDAAGRNVYNSEKPALFTPTQPNWNAWAWMKPDYKVHKAGKWKWVAEIKGHGKFSAEVGVLPATPDELAGLARYEKARDNALFAFTHYWLGLDGTFHTMISYEHRLTEEEKRQLQIAATAEQQEKTLAQEEERLTAAIASDRTDSWARMTRERDLRIQLERVQASRRELRQQPVPRIPMNRYFGYLEVAGLEWNMVHGGLSEADHLNGITYRGSLRVVFRVFRYCRPEGWTDWEDCQRLPYAFNFLFGSFFDGVPSELGEKLNLRFDIMERDRNWFVQSPSGDEFVNGKLVTENSQWKNTPPLPAHARELATGKISFTREHLRAMGQAARNDPAALEQSAIATMAMLRGKDLIR